MGAIGDMSILQEFIVWTGGLIVASLVAVGVDEVVTAERTPPLQAEAVEIAALREEGR